MTLPAGTPLGDFHVLGLLDAGGMGQVYRFDYLFAPGAVVEFYCKYDGPATSAFATLGEADGAELRAALVDLWASHNQASESARTFVDAEYLGGIRA